MLFMLCVTVTGGLSAARLLAAARRVALATVNSALRYRQVDISDRGTSMIYPYCNICHYHAGSIFGSRFPLLLVNSSMLATPPGKYLLSHR